MAEQQEIQTLVRVADAAMSGQSAPADFPIQFQNDFLKAQGSRVWVPIILTLDPAKTPSGALTLYLRVTPRGMTAPPPPRRPRRARQERQGQQGQRQGQEQESEGARPAPPPAAPNYPFEDVSFLDVKPGRAGPAAADPARHRRSRGQLRSVYRAARAAPRRRRRRGAAPAAPAVPPRARRRCSSSRWTSPTTGREFSTSTVILAERVDQLPTPITPDAQSEHPYAFGQTEIVVAPDHKFKKSQELIVLMQIYNPMVTPEKKFNLEATYTFYRQDAGTEKRFNSTEPQIFSSETHGGGFRPLGEQQHPGGPGGPPAELPGRDLSPGNQDYG